MPTDAAALLRVAEASNGLQSPDLKPWHLKVSYELFDDAEKSSGKGTYEEWWAAPDKWKRSYAGDGFTQTLYKLGNLDGSTGNNAAWPFPAETLMQLPERPMPTDAEESDTIPIRKV